MKTQKYVENILIIFKGKIKKSLKNIPYQEREDLEQELLTKIVEKINDVEFREPQGFWYMVEVNYKHLPIHFTTEDMYYYSIIQCNKTEETFR